MSKPKKLTITLVTVVLVTMAAFMAFDIRINSTASLPLGLYMNANKEALQREDIVNFAVPDNSITKLQFEKHPFLPVPKDFLKIIYGVAGDQVEVQKDFAYVLDADGGCHMMRLKSLSILESGIIPKGYVFVGSPHPQSFDSRYYGLIKTSTITGVYKPLLTTRI